jgi:hypothetical protein
MSEDLKQEEETLESIAGFDMNNPKSVEDKITELTQELMAGAFDIINRLKKGEKISDAEKIYQDEGQKQVQYLTKLYNNMKKIGVVSSVASAEAFDKNFFKKLKEKSGTMGNIIVNDTREDKNKE